MHMLFFPKCTPARRNPHDVLGESAYSLTSGYSAPMSPPPSSVALCLLRLRSKLRPSSSELTAAMYGMPMLFSIKWLDRMRKTLVSGTASIAPVAPRAHAT